MRKTLLIGMALLIALAACTTQPLVGDNMTNATPNASMENQTIPADMADMDNESANESADLSEYAAVIRATEGELIDLNTRAVDPDGDEVELMFEDPFNAQGQWQTEQGDAGEYEIQVTATDGQEETQLTLLVVVDKLNLPPSIQGPDIIEVEEGEKIDLAIYEITDPEGDELVISYSGWMSGSEYTTDFDDAGEHEVRIIAEDDAGNEVFKEVTIEVENVNRAPELTIEETTLEGTEGDRLRIQASAQDPDGEDVEISYGEPFNEEGTWQTQQGDAGEYSVLVTATDGQEEVTETVSVMLEPRNRAPVIIVDEPIVVSEGETLDLSEFLTINDPDGDEVLVQYSGWMTQPTKELDYQSSGEYGVTVSASDGELTESVDVTIEVQNVNRPPVFTQPA